MKTFFSNAFYSLSYDLQRSRPTWTAPSVRPAVTVRFDCNTKPAAQEEFSSDSDDLDYNVHQIETHEDEEEFNHTYDN